MIHVNIDEKVRLTALVVMLLIVSVICLIFKKSNDNYTEEVEEMNENNVEIENTEIIENNEVEEPLVQSPLLVSKDWSSKDAYLLAKIAMAEAEGEDLKGKALVICVVLNRANSTSFPNTIEEVIFEKSGTAYQFSSVIPGGRWYTTEPNEDCYKAVEMVQAGWDESNGALYFESCKNEDNWHSRNLIFLFKHERHRFYK